MFTSQTLFQGVITIKNHSCLMSIKNNYKKLTDAEKKVADYIVKNSSEVIVMSISELSEKSNSAKSAVIRCCKSLGFNGYSDLKISLAMELSKNKQLNYTPYISPDDNAGDILDKVFSANVKALHDTAEKTDRKVLQNVVDLLSLAKTVYIYGIGTSASLAREFQYRLMQFGYTAIYYTDVPSMKISTMNIKKGDVAIGISHSGRTIATVDALKLADNMGADTVCITSYPESEITKVSDYSIEIFSDEIQYPVEAVSARIAHLSIIDAICIALSAKNYESAIIRAKNAHDLVNTIRH